MKVDKNYWANELEPPYCPSENDFYIYKNNLSIGKTLLLGCTHKLIPISDFQMDIDPWYQSSSVITQEWTTNQIFYENIIGDGVLNFTKELTDNLLLMCKDKCNNFIARCFKYKMPKMRIADYFPDKKDFSINPFSVIEFDDYNFFYWRFK